MLQDAAHNPNNRIAIGALIYVKTRRATDSKAVGHAQPTALPSSPRPYRAPNPSHGIGRVVEGRLQLPARRGKA
jgi:hypothetical protein